jgi:hypothetical protein
MRRRARQMAQEIVAEEPAWPERVGEQLRAEGLTRGGVADRTVALLREGGVTEEQVRSSAPMEWAGVWSAGFVKRFGRLTDHARESPRKVGPWSDLV